MKKILLWIGAIIFIILINNLHWLSFIKVGNINYKLFVLILGYIWLPIIVIKFIYIYHKYDREYIKILKEGKINFKNELPFEVEYLFKNKITFLSYTASILSLIEKGVFIAKPIFISKKIIEKIDYIFILNKKYNLDHLSTEELKLKNFLVHEIGNDNYWTYEGLKTIAYKNKSCLYFNNIYSNWKDLSNIICAKDNIFEGKPKGFLNLNLWVTFIGLCIGLFLIINNINLYLGFYLLAAVLGFGFYISTFTRMTKEYTEIYSEWYKVKKELMNLNSTNKYNITSAEEWEKYLIYSLVLGNNKKIEKLMEAIVLENNDTFNSDLFLLVETGFVTKLKKAVFTNIFSGFFATIIPLSLFSFWKTYQSNNLVMETYNDYYQNSIQEIDK